MSATFVQVVFNWHPQINLQSIQYPNGKPPTSSGKLQKLYSTVLPNSNAPICCCIASFTHTLLELNLKTSSNKWMQPPSPGDLLTSSNLPAFNWLHPIDSSPPLAIGKVTENVPSICHALFIHNLNLSQLLRSNFACIPHFNQLIPPATCYKMVFFIVGLSGVRAVYDWANIPSTQGQQIKIPKENQITITTISPNEMELFDLIKCSSDTKLIPQKVLFKIPVSWRSMQSSQLAGHLDEIHIHKVMATLGPLHVQAFILEQIQKPSSTQLASTPVCNVLLSHPINCYCYQYLSTLSGKEKQLLSIRPEINFSKLLSITKRI
ncbi:hypothetical protein VP01_2224g1 [Puccinia sorghi]|uniref:Uncharacterized protein n=1 Tax=Puccinia sorghi TaxID=27349 RepID=A0A0L6V8W8_9BASI|nr:hypothetical protein VP01_2224g1 [Puccinia sorghi]